MRRLIVIFAVLLVAVIAMQAAPVSGQGDGGFRWPIPANDGAMPAEPALLPPATAMPALPLPEALIPGTVFFNVEDYGEEYRILNLTFDSRRYAYNITTQRGALPVSPNGQYAVITLSDHFEGPVTCAIIDLLTQVQVDEFQTDGACSGVAWSPDSTRLLLTVTDDQGVQSLGLRQNGDTTLFRPVPAPESDLGGVEVSEDRIYIINGWISNNTFSFDIGLQGVLSESLFTSTDKLDLAVPAISLTRESSDKPLILWRPAQPLGAIDRGLWLTNLDTGDSFQLAPAGHTAIFGDVSPAGDEVAYWAAPLTETGPGHPLRLAVYDPATEAHEVLLQFDGPVEALITRPGLVVFNNDYIYFHIGQLPEAQSPLQTGSYRISRDGMSLDYITEYLLMSSLPDTVEAAE